METNKLNTKDEKLKNLFAASKIKADENLKFRIMQQIHTESLFVKSRNKREGRINRRIRNLVSVFAVAYVLILIIAISFYSLFGKETIWLPEFYFSMIFITVISTIFGIIDFFDEKIRSRYRSKSGK